MAAVSWQPRAQVALRLRTASRLRGAHLILALAAVLALAALQGLSFTAAPYGGKAQVARRRPLVNHVQATTVASGRSPSVGLAARGGADEDEYEFNPGGAGGVAMLKTGQELEGIVTKCMPFGAFVDIGGEKDGLVPLAKMQQGRTENCEDVVSPGDGVKVWVAEVSGDKLTLSMVKSKATPRGQGGGMGGGPRADLSLFADIPETEWLNGKVVGVQSFGAFVSVKPPSGGDLEAQGLVHITQIKDGFVNDVSEELEVGQEVRVRIQSCDVAAGKLGLTMKTEAGGSGNVLKSSGGGRAGGGKKADLSSFEGISDQEWLPGTVVSLQNYGAFVEVTAPSGGEPVQGLLHISQIKEGFLEDPGEELEVDQEVKVRVLEVNTGEGKLALSMKQPVAAE